MLRRRLLALIGCSGTAFAQFEEGKGDVPYVPTPEQTAEEMLKLAGVKAGDTVYDLGCGDGRIVIRAAKQFGALGVGIDIDPQRIADAKERARAEGVTNRVRFIEQDLFKADLSGATVVTLYLLSSVNRRLRPKLLAELAPGTRIVSHQFDMDDWKPAKRVIADGRTLYLWIVPERR